MFHTEALDTLEELEYLIAMDDYKAMARAAFIVAGVRSAFGDDKKPEDFLGDVPKRASEVRAEKEKLDRKIEEYKAVARAKGVQLPDASR